MHLRTVLASICSLALVNASSDGESTIQNKRMTFQDYYLRASEQLAAGREAQALLDLKEVLRLSPEFTPAQYYLAATYLKLGVLDKARESAAESVCQDSRCAGVIADVDNLVSLMADAKAAFSAEEYETCILVLTEVLEVASKSAEALKLRAEARFARGSAIEALYDLHGVIQQHPEDTETTARLAIAQYVWLNNVDKAQQLIRRCVQYDNEAKDCIWANRQIRQLQKLVQSQPAYKLKYGEVKQKVVELQSWVSRGVTAQPDGDEVENDGDLLNDIRHERCEGLAERGQWERAARVCARVRDTDPEFPAAMLVQAYLDKSAGNSGSAAESASHLLNHPEVSDKIREHATRLYQEIQAERMQQQQQQWQRFQQGQQRANGGGPAPSPEKDLYATLGVEKDADTKAIRKAYRNLSKQYHPDKYRGSELSEDEVMQKMQDINEAYETLSNEDKRRDYDATREYGGGGGAGAGFGGGAGGFGGMDNEILQRFFGAGGAGQRMNFKF